MQLVEATATAVCGVSLGAVGMLLGETGTPMSMASADWIHVAGGLTSLGFAVWYAWHTTTRTIPEKDKLHQETIKNIVSEFRDEAKEQRASHEHSINKFDNTLDRLSTAIERAVSK